jgi:hypothetical protein
MKAGAATATGTGPAGGPSLEAEALPWILAVIAAGQGDAAGARWLAPLGPPAGRTLLGAFLRAVALAAAGDPAGAVRAALEYRARFPVLPWQGRDPWAGGMFR